MKSTQKGPEKGSRTTVKIDWLVAELHSTEQGRITSYSVIQKGHKYIPNKSLLYGQREDKIPVQVGTRSLVTLQIYGPWVAKEALSTAQIHIPPD